jgi:hypothetical protein
MLIVKYLPELSYLPDNSTTWNATSSYREWSYYYLKPGTEAAVEKILASWRDLYKSKDVKMGFRVFTNFVGGDGPLIILTTWANDPMDYQTTLEETLKLLGTDGAGLMEAMLKNVNKTKTIEGWYLPQYSYDFSN